MPTPCWSTASTRVSNAGLYLCSTSSGKPTGIKSGLGLHVAQVWDELHSEPWGLWYQPLLQKLYPAPTPSCLWAPRFSFQSSALVRSSSCGSLAFCSSDRHRPLLLTQASRLETQDCPHHAPRKQHKTVFRNWGSLWLCSRAPAAEWHALTSLFVQTLANTWPPVKSFVSASQQSRHSKCQQSRLRKIITFTVVCVCVLAYVPVCLWKSEDSMWGPGSNQAWWQCLSLTVLAVQFLNCTVKTLNSSRMTE